MKESDFHKRTAEALLLPFLFFYIAQGGFFMKFPLDIPAKDYIIYS